MEILRHILQLRLVVGLIGEKSYCNWWGTSFFDSSSKVFMEPVFVKTIRLAQYHAVIEAARRLHDEHLNVGSYHLFRLPEEYEQDIHSLVNMSESDAIFSEIFTADQDPKLILKKLSMEISLNQEGPQLVGKISQLNEDMINSIGGLYLSAFLNNKKTYPYLES